ncbi:hypothetical protein ELE40_23075 (plasmid) [Escherichia coli]|nr:hypothetical protein EM855_23075 [Escherichia coli]AZU78561.1 hypothetical protein ELE40_23075 [Escherichia coli]
MLPSETMIWQPEFTDKTLSRKPGAVQFFCKQFCCVSTVSCRCYGTRCFHPTGGGQFFICG